MPIADVGDSKYSQLPMANIGDSTTYYWQLPEVDGESRCQQLNCTQLQSIEKKAQPHNYSYLKTVKTSTENSLLLMRVKVDEGNNKCKQLPTISLSQ